MKVFTVRIGTENSDFDSAPEFEIVRILRNVANRLEKEGREYGCHTIILDLRGNAVGTTAYIEE